jgi:muramoyltetrapeptide carboxypeptidase
MISRRALFAGVAGIAATTAFAKDPKRRYTAGRKMIFPPRLKPGDKVAICAPASQSNDPESLAKATANVQSLGFEVVVMPNAGNWWGSFAGTDQERADDLNAAIKDPTIKGIICLRGGYGTMRMLPMVDYDAFRKHPKIVMGYSDITGLLNALTRKSGVVTYHGPIAEAKFEGFEGSEMKKAIFEGEELGEFPYPTTLKGKPSTPASRTIQEGKAKGRLVGGNLSLIEPIAGSPYSCDFKGSILFLEDINEAAYRVDRMLTSLWLKGHLKDLKGIILGDFRPVKEEASRESKDFSMDQVFDNLKLWTDIPIFCGVYAGHISDKLTLPIGANIEMDADARTFKFIP